MGKLAMGFYCFLDLSEVVALQDLGPYFRPFVLHFLLVVSLVIWEIGGLSGTFFVR